MKREGMKMEWYYYAATQKALFMWCLVSMVHHAGSLLKIIETDPGHSFESIPILSNSSLLYESTKLLTSEPLDRIRIVTGIPPHVETMSKIKDLTSLIQQERGRID